VTKQSKQAYSELVEALLKCSEGDEKSILTSQPELVDEGLVRELLCVADILAANDDGVPAIIRLRELANHLKKQLKLEPINDLNVFTSAEDFINAIFQAVYYSRGDINVLHSLFWNNLVLLNERSIATLKANFHRLRYEDKLSFAYNIGIFAHAISNFRGGNRYLNLEMAIDVYYLKLEVHDLEKHPRDWAVTQINLANVYSDRIQGKRAENLEISIEYYKYALQVCNQQSYPLDWAAAQSNLANTYSSRIRGERAENLELSIEGYRSVLQVYTQEVCPKDWAETQNKLANAYSSRIRGERVENLELSIECCKLALEVYTQETFPEGWAETQILLGVAYHNRIRGERAENIELSIEYSKSALKIYTQEIFPEAWANIQNNLAGTYIYRIRGEQAENLELSIECCQSALQVYTQQAFPEGWANTQNSLANAYCYRIRGERAKNIELSIECCESALQVYTQDAFPEGWAMTQDNLGNIYGYRIYGEKADNQKLSIECYKSALQIYTQQAFPEIWAKTQINLADAYREQIGEEWAENLELSIECCQSALQVCTQQAYPESWALTQGNLGNAYSQRIKGAKSENLEQAVKFYKSALKVYTPQSFPTNCLTVARSLERLASREGNWQLVIQSCDLAIQAVEMSRCWATNEDSRQEILRNALDVYLHAIEASINNHQLDLAISYSERARSRQLVDFMATQDLYPNGQSNPEIETLLAKYRDNISQIQTHQNSLSTPTQDDFSRGYSKNSSTVAAALYSENNQIWQQIRQHDPVIAGQIQVAPIDLPTIQSLIPNSQTAILSFYSTENDTHIFIITQHQPPKIYTLKGQGLVTFQRWLRDIWLTQHINDSDLSYSLLSEIASRLDLNVLVSKLLDINEIIIIPHMYLHQIPFAALPLTPAQETREGDLPMREALGNYLGDRFTIRYAPSCQILKYCTDRPSINKIQYGTVEDADGTLVGARFEGQQIAKLYKISSKYRLRGKSQASIKNYQQLLNQATNIHASHHASFSIDNPLASYLKLADGNISMSDIIISRYPNLNEVFLACCETNLGSTTFTDDLLTIATAFLCSGARCVISSLWNVDDFATLIFSVFYHQFRQDGIDRSSAIKQAQRRLRTLNKDEIDEFLDNLKTEKPILPDEQLQLYDRIQILKDFTYAQADLDELKQKWRTFRRHQKNNPYPFSNPYYWAGFTCQGLTDVNNHPDEGVK
jgi:CHAT domain-containing protein